jgi:hypothetical protein
MDISLVARLVKAHPLRATGSELGQDPIHELLEHVG